VLFVSFVVKTLVGYVRSVSILRIAELHLFDWIPGDWVGYAPYATGLPIPVCIGMFLLLMSIGLWLRSQTAWLLTVMAAVTGLAHLYLLPKTAVKARTVVAVNEAKHLNRVRRVHPDLIIAPQVLGGELLTK
jgi:hypothetical protein